MKKFLLPLALTILMLVGCAREDTPEAALEDIKQAIEQCDEEKFSARVDVRSLLSVAYDDASLESRRAHEIHQRGRRGVL